MFDTSATEIESTIWRGKLPDQSHAKLSTAIGHRDMCGIRVILFVVGGRAGNFQHSEESFLRNVHAAHALHALLAFFLLLEKFSFARNIAAVAFGYYVLADCTNCFARDHVAPDGGLHRNLKHLPRDSLPPAAPPFAPALLRLCSSA